MSNTHSIQVVTMLVEPSIKDKVNVVKKVVFATIATDQNGNSAQVLHDFWTDVENLTSFTEYNSLTEAQVIDWIKTGFNSLSLQSLQNDADNALLAKQTPQPSFLTLPWA